MLEEGLIRSALIEVQTLKSDVADSGQESYGANTPSGRNYGRDGKTFVPQPSLASPPSGHFPVQSNPHILTARANASSPHRLILIHSSSTTNRSSPGNCSVPATAIQQCYKHQFQPISSTSYLSTRHRCKSAGLGINALISATANRTTRLALGIDHSF